MLLINDFTFVLLGIIILLQISIILYIIQLNCRV